MTCSMTAFAHAAEENEHGKLGIELRSVNHRYLDLSLRLPEELRLLEPELRKRLTARLSRGKVELTLRYQPSGQQSAQVDRSRIGDLAYRLREVESIFSGHVGPVNPMEILRWPGVLVQAEVDLQPVTEAALALTERCLAELVDNRDREGARLAVILIERCAAVETIVDEISQQVPALIERQRERLQERLAELRESVDGERLEQEIALAAQKLDIREELDRLLLHLDEVRRVIGADEPAGRRLDFLMQELNREANTLGSKSGDPVTSRAAVDLKVLIEQMREQIQNIE